MNSLVGYIKRSKIERESPLLWQSTVDHRPSTIDHNLRFPSLTMDFYFHSSFSSFFCCTYHFSSFDFHSIFISFLFSLSLSFFFATGLYKKNTYVYCRLIPAIEPSPPLLYRSINNNKPTPSRHHHQASENNNFTIKMAKKGPALKLK